MDNNFDSKNLIDKYSDIILYIANRYLNNIDDSQDILQEVFIKYIRYIKSGRGFKDEYHEKKWIYKVARNLSYNEANSAKNKKNIPLNEYNNSEIEFVSETDIELMNAINKLKDIHREAFKLFYIEDFKISDISKILSITETNVRTRLKRAREEIKKYFEL